jgi:mRNA interferase MazF
MMCKPGDLVGIPFPYSNLTTRKRRPVLVMTSPDRHGDFMGLAVTSVETEESAVALVQEDMIAGSLPRNSWIRYDKIFTLSTEIVAKTYGVIKDELRVTVMDDLCRYIGCDMEL